MSVSSSSASWGTRKVMPWTTKIRLATTWKYHGCGFTWNEDYLSFPKNKFQMQFYLAGATWRWAWISSFFKRVWSISVGVSIIQMIAVLRSDPATVPLVTGTAVVLDSVHRNVKIRKTRSQNHHRYNGSLLAKSPQHPCVMEVHYVLQCNKQ